MPWTWELAQKIVIVVALVGYESSSLTFFLQIKYLAEHGLINFSLTSVLNAIPLCPTCHLSYDAVMDPGLVIVHQI